MWRTAGELVLVARDCGITVDAASGAKWRPGFTGLQHDARRTRDQRHVPSVANTHARHRASSVCSWRVDNTKVQCGFHTPCHTSSTATFASALRRRMHYSLHTSAPAGTESGERPSGVRGVALVLDEATVVDNFATSSDNSLA